MVVDVCQLGDQSQQDVGHSLQWHNYHWNMGMGGRKILRRNMRLKNLRTRKRWNQDKKCQGEKMVEEMVSPRNLRNQEYPSPECQNLHKLLWSP